MLIDKGDLLLVAHRRLYPGDAERFFLGKVEEYEQGLARVSGYTWIHDAHHGQLTRKEDRRCKVLSISSGTLIVYVLPKGLELEQLEIEHLKSRMFLSDRRNFIMDISDRMGLER